MVGLFLNEVQAFFICQRNLLLSVSLVCHFFKLPSSVFRPVLGGYGFCVWESIFRVVLGVGSAWRSAWVGVVWAQKGV